MPAYYNEIDPFAAEWLRELIRQGHIAPGDVDTRSIEDVTPNELRSYTQCHFFAGIGVWSYALRRAGWSDERPIWTGSCPCQPFSAAGKGTGFTDERHLWPAFFHLIKECRPGVVFGEQVASKDGLAWFDLVSTDLEGEDYANAAIDLCAAGVGAPHIRQRLYWGAERLADANDTRSQGWREPKCKRPTQLTLGASGVVSGLADTDGGNPGAEREQHGGKQRLQQKGGGDVWPGHQGAWLGDAQELERPSPTNGLWRDADWLYCRDGRWRPVEPGAFPLAHGYSARVGRLRGYGNAINAETAVAFIEAYMNPVIAKETPVAEEIVGDQPDLFSGLTPLYNAPSVANITTHGDER